jgi:ADP-heptose:LPS heptosyltransferase
MAAPGPLTYRNWSARARRIAGALDLVAGLAAPALRRLSPRGESPAVPRSILCVRCDHLGDQLMTTPAYAALRAAFPAARIDVLAAPSGRAALTGNPDVQAVREGIAPWYDPRYPALAGFSRAAAIGRELARDPYDWAFDFRGDPRVLLLYVLPAARRRFGFSGLGLERLLTDGIPYRRDRPPLDLALDLCRLAGAEARSRRPVFRPPPASRAHAQEALRAAGIPEGSPFALLAPGSNRPSARWPVRAFAAVAAALGEAGFRVASTGSPADAPLLRELTAGGAAIADLATGIDVPALGALLEQASLLVGNDSAPVHLGVAVSCPVVAVFGPSDPRLTFPYDDPARFVALAGPSDHPRPCWDPRCPSDHGLTALAPSDVVAAALRVARPRAVPA